MVVAVAAGAAVLVARHLATKPLWLDEAVSVSVASRPLPQLAAVLTHHDASAGLYYVLLHTWLRLGQGRAWDRLPSALCLVGSAALAAWIGSRWGTRWTGVACGALVAANPFLLFYGQEARPYALAVLLALASTAALFWRDGEPAPTAYVVATVALLYADLFAVLFVACQAGAVLVVHRRRPHNVPPALVRSWGLIALGALPLALIIVLREGSQISWLPRPSPAALWQTVLSMAGGGAALAVMVGLVTLGALVALGVVAIPPGDRRPSGDTVAGSRLRLALPALASSFAVPPVLLWTFAQVVPSFLSRYVICSTIGLIGLAVFGLEVGRRVAGVAAASTVLLGIVALGTAAAVRFEG
ncbi:MAG TPA: hypothetical protein VGI06_17680, partial [Acidimicrobiales bacterium]